MERSDVSGVAPQAVWLMLRKLVAQAASVAGLRVIGTGLSVLVTIAIARLFGADVLGAYAYCVALMAIAAVPVSNGWSTMLLRTVSGEGAVNGEARAMQRMGAFGAVLMAILAGAAGLLAIRYGTTAVADILRPVAFAAIGLLAFALVCDQISAMRMATIRGLDRPSLAQLPEMMIRPAMLLLGIAISWLWFNPSDAGQAMPRLFGALASAALIAALFGQFVLHRVAGNGQAERVEGSHRRTWLASAGALAGSAGLVQLNGYVDMLLLGSFVSAEEIGLYRTALQIAMLASFGYIALNMLAGQRFARFRKLDDRVGMAKTATWLARMAFAAALPLPLLLLAFGEQIFAALFGASFSEAALPALIIASGLAFSAAIGMARTLLVMHRLEFLVMRTTFVALTINVVLCFILIPRYGVVGAAMANFTATCSWNLLLWLLARRKTGMDSSVIGLSPKAAMAQDGGANG